MTYRPWLWGLGVIKIEIARKNLIEHIKEAFSNVTLPSKEKITLCTCDECKTVRENISQYSNASWESISDDFIDEYCDCMPLLSPEAFHFMLPAILIFSLKYFDSGYNGTGFTISTLCPGKDWEHSKDWWKNRFERFSAAQVDLVFKFLDMAYVDEGFESYRVVIERGKRRLEIILRSEE